MHQQKSNLSRILVGMSDPLNNGVDDIKLRWTMMYTFATVDDKGKASSLDIAPLTILDSGALQPRKWQLIGIDCSTVAQASGCS